MNTDLAEINAVSQGVVNSFSTLAFQPRGGKATETTVRVFFSDGGFIRYYLKKWDTFKLYTHWLLVNSA